MSAQTTFSHPDIGTDFVGEPKQHLPASDLTCPAAIRAADIVVRFSAFQNGFSTPVSLRPVRMIGNQVTEYLCKRLS